MHAFDSFEELVAVCWTDAALANRPDLSSTGGRVMGLALAAIAEGHEAPVRLVSRRSGKLPRVARSSLSAEVQALPEGNAELLYVRLHWQS